MSRYCSLCIIATCFIVTYFTCQCIITLQVMWPVLLLGDSVGNILFGSILKSHLVMAELKNSTHKIIFISFRIKAEMEMEERRIRAMREMKMQEVNAYIEWEREKMRMQMELQKQQMQMQQLQQQQIQQQPLQQQQQLQPRAAASSSTTTEVFPYRAFLDDIAHL